jgi:hypothetical protein
MSPDRPGPPVPLGAQESIRPGETLSATVMARLDAVEARLAADVQAVRGEIESQTTTLRTELQAFAGSLHASTIARLDALHTRVESDLMALLTFRQAPDSDLESELTDSMRLVIERATAEIRQALLDRSDLNMRVLEQELVRVTSRLESRLDDIASGNPGAAPSRAPTASEP